MGLVIEQLCRKMRLRDRFEDKQDGQIHLALLESAIDQSRLLGQELKSHARVSLGEPIDNGRNEALSEDDRTPNSNVPYRRIG